MGGKAAMRLALTQPARVTRLVVADIAPVPYASHFGTYVPAMLSVDRAMTRAQADAALAAAVPEPAVRGFLLHNFRPGEGWRIGLEQIAGSLRRVESWDGVEGRYDGPVLFVTGARSDYVLPSYHGAIRALFPAAAFVEIAAAGHWLHAEQPAAFNSAVTGFLA